VAVEDFCPHRGAPLSLGFVRDGTLVCGYHGLEMGCGGKTLGMPGQRVGVFPAVRPYAAVERHGFIWVWPGDQAKADPALIPYLEWAESPDWAYGGGLYHIQCDYRLMIDNLMDLTHETYVHASSIGQKEIDEAAFTYSQQVESGERVIVGVNRYAEPEAEQIELHRLDPEAERRQLERTARVRAERDTGEAEAAVARVLEAGQGTENLLPPLREALRARCTIGEICNVLRDEFGMYDAQRGP
jgi:phenylpropionate dioxygenase-like ring-hydroxylating dioxygenase large terminal subunit